MATFQPPPTYANPVLIDEVTGRATFNPIWLKWFVDVASFISGSGGGAGSVGTGAFVHQISPTLITPTLGVAAGTSLTLTGALTVAGLVSLFGGATLLKTTTALTNNAAAAAGTLLNAPVAGNPTKWVAINDAGTTRYLPLW